MQTSLCTVANAAAHQSHPSAAARSRGLQKKAAMKASILHRITAAVLSVSITLGVVEANALYGHPAGAASNLAGHPVPRATAMAQMRGHGPAQVTMTDRKVMAIRGDFWMRLYPGSAAAEQA